MATYIAIWIVLFPLSGEPIAFSELIPMGRMCDNSFALERAAAKAAELNILMKEDLLWMCESFVDPNPPDPVAPADDA